jgi:hypothetical protein
MNDETRDETGEALLHAMNNHMGDLLRAKCFARNMANTLHAIYLKAPAGSEIEADLQALREYTVDALKRVLIAEEILNGLMNSADSPEPDAKEIADESSVKATVH